MQPKATTQWYFAKAKKKLGPYDFNQLCQLARTRLLAPEDMVYQAGTPKWMPACSVPELCQHFDQFERPGNQPCPVATVIHCAQTPKDLRLEQWQELRILAFRQRLLIVAVVVEFLTVIPVQAIGSFAAYLPPKHLLAFNLYALAMHLAFLIPVVLLALSVRRSPLFAVFLFVPVFSVALLLSLNRKATRLLQAHGLNVGLWGADLPQTPPATFTVSEARKTGFWAKLLWG